MLNPYNHKFPEDKPVDRLQDDCIHITDEMPRFLVESIGLEAGRRVLDASCDPGRLLPYLKTKLQRTGHIFILNPSRAECGKSADSERVTELNASADNIPLGDSAVDFIICLSSFNGFLNREAVVFEFFRILKPGGKTMIVHCGWEKTPSFVERNTMTIGLPPCPAGLNAVFSTAGFFRNNIIYLPNWFVFTANKRGHSLGGGRVI